MKLFYSKHLRNLVTILLFGGLLHFGVAAQLDSIAVDVSTVSGVNPMDTTEAGYIMTVDVVVNDINDLGDLAVIVFDEEQEWVVARLIGTKAELIAQNLVSGNEISVDFFIRESAGIFRVETLVKNNIKAQLPRVITSHNL